jgi:ribosomal protein S18 acetylase RimI-like enzyme
MPSGCSIVRLRPADWQRFRVIRLRALRESPEAFGSTLEEEQNLTDTDWPDRLARPEVATFVARATDQTDVGLAVGAPYDDEAGLYAMWVAPEARGTGIGSALIDAVIAWASEIGHTKILLDVGDHNAPAIALYERNGFKATGRAGALPPPRIAITEHQRMLVLKL